MNLGDQIVVDDVVDGLNELRSRELQERLWLSDGSSGEVSSFEEAICGIFDDGGVTRALDSRGLSPELEQLFKQLDKLIDEIPTNVHPSVVIEHPSMAQIKAIAGALLEKIEMHE